LLHKPFSNLIWQCRTLAHISDGNNNTSNQKPHSLHAFLIQFPLFITLKLIQYFHCHVYKTKLKFAFTNVLLNGPLLIQPQRDGADENQSNMSSVPTFGM